MAGICQDWEVATATIECNDVMTQFKQLYTKKLEKLEQAQDEIDIPNSKLIKTTKERDDLLFKSHDARIPIRQDLHDETQRAFRRISSTIATLRPRGETRARTAMQRLRD